MEIKEAQSFMTVGVLQVGFRGCFDWWEADSKITVILNPTDSGFVY